MASIKYCDKHNQVGFLKKPEESTGFVEIVDFLKGSHIRYALTHNPTIHDSLVKQFWQTATASTLADGTLELRATIDTLEYTITEASVRSQADQAGIQSPPSSSTVPPPPTSQPAPTESTHSTYHHQESDIHKPRPTPYMRQRYRAHVQSDDLFQLVPQLMTRIESLEIDLKQTKKTMENAIVKPKQGKSSGETDISPQGLEAAETLAEVLSQIKTKRRNVKTGVRRRLDAEDVSTGFEGFEEVSTGFTDIKFASENVSFCSFGEQMNIGCKKIAKGVRGLEAQRNEWLKCKRDAQFYTEEDWDTIRAKLEANADLVKEIAGEDVSEAIMLRECMERFMPMDIEKESRKRNGEELQTESSKKLKSDIREDVSVPKEKDNEKGLQRKPESTKSGTEEDVEAYMEERVDEPSSEEFPMGIIPQGPAPAKIVKWQIIKTGKRGAYSSSGDNTDVLLQRSNRDDTSVPVSKRCCKEQGAASNSRKSNVVVPNILKDKVYNNFQKLKDEGDFQWRNAKRESFSPWQEKLKLNKLQELQTTELKRMAEECANALGRDLHWTTVKNILKYLRNTKDMFLVYKRCCFDRMITKACFFATSFVEAEYIAAYDASKEAVWVRKFIYGLGVVPTIEEPIKMYYDK
ncbi:hypothetical protein Tco_0953162 [Tanacetum coccineum]|uniref:Uncharacterized protein n=1 Tax=Tanacetum coccineum TaxID=301880 RepID=A0ABQ5E1D6_9ASTR